MPRELTYTSVRWISSNACDYNKLDSPHQIEEGKPFGNLTKKSVILTNCTCEIRLKISL